MKSRANQVRIPEKLHDQLKSRMTSLEAERSSWIDHWQEISRVLLPRSGRFYTTDRNRGDKRHNNILDSSATRAHRILVAGLMAGMTSPARPWFRLSTGDPALDQFHSVRQWLWHTRQLMLTIFAKSNTYDTLQVLYGELGAFGTGNTILMPDFDTVIWHYPSPIGEYCLATDYKGRVNTSYRKFEKTVGELVGEFGRDAVSSSTRNAYDSGKLEKTVEVCHIIEPRADREPNKLDARNMPFRSIYFESSQSKGEVLRESGLKRFRALCPRWDRQSGDVYGHSPGMEALGDVKQLQHEQFRKAQGIDYKTKPPLQAPTAMRNNEINMLPGGVSFIDIAGDRGGIRSAFEARIELDHLLLDIQDVRERINASFFADLFLMITQVDNQMTATEVAERHEEKLLVLGPVLERLHNELLSPLIDMTFERMVEAGIVPPPPPELQGIQLDVEFISTLAQAQRAIGVQATDRFIANIGAVAALGKADVLDKFNSDAWVDKYSDMLGIDPDLIVANEQVALIRQERAEQQAAMQQAEMANMAADTASKLGNTPSAVQTGQQPTVLNDIFGLFQGYNSPPAETY